MNKDNELIYKETGSNGLNLAGFMDMVRNTLLGFAIAAFVLAAFCLFYGIKPAVITSGSMEPTIHTGSLAFINTRDKTVEVGDVIAFTTAGNNVTHRVVRITEEGYITRGDANETEDPWLVTDNAVMGHTDLTIPYLGYAVMYMTRGSGKYIAISVILMLFLSTFLGYGEEAEYGRRYRKE